MHVVKLKLIDGVKNASENCLAQHIVKHFRFGRLHPFALSGSQKERRAYFFWLDLSCNFPGDALFNYRAENQKTQP